MFWPHNSRENVLKTTSFVLSTHSYYAAIVLQEAPEGAVFILHTCAHNPTGVDPSTSQWKEILTVIKVRQGVCHTGFLSRGGNKKSN